MCLKRIRNNLNGHTILPISQIVVSRKYEDQEALLKLNNQVIIRVSDKKLWKCHKISVCLIDNLKISISSKVCYINGRFMYLESA